jgi:hypothetical protein
MKGSVSFGRDPSPVHAAVFCVAAPQRASALQQAKRGDGGVLIAGGKASGQNKLTDDGNSPSLSHFLSLSLSHSFLEKQLN